MSATCSRILASRNSRYRSFPSRVRSPTPQKTDFPPWPLATLLISSWMTTVLPTPAPPNRPILPPFTNGAMRSMTLMPVSKISVLGSRSVNFGGEPHRNRPAAVFDHQCVVDLGQVLGLELDVQHRPDDLHDSADVLLG